VICFSVILRDPVKADMGAETLVYVCYIMEHEPKAQGTDQGAAYRPKPT
jgi:hypothetical protein